MAKIVIVEPEQGIVDADLIEQRVGYRPAKGSNTYIVTCGPGLESDTDGYETVLLVGECLFIKSSHFTSVQYIDIDGDVNGQILDILESGIESEDGSGLDQGEIGSE